MNAVTPKVMLGSSRWKLASVHLLISALILALVGLALFLIWYPPPFGRLSGGLKLFGLLAVVDVVLGPLGTLVVSNPKKPRAEWRRDVLVIVLLQLSALGYGLVTAYQARPAFLVFEIDRFRVVHAADIPRSMLHLAPEGLREVPVVGRKLAAVRPFRDAREHADATLVALQGLDLGARPDLWQLYAEAVSAVLAAAQPLATLERRSPAVEQGRIREAVRNTGLDGQDIVYLPLVSRTQFGTVLLDRRSGEPIGFLDVDGFGP